MHAKTKICPKCGLEIVLNLFDRNSNNADGLSDWCLNCTRAAVAPRYRRDYDRKVLYGRADKARRKEERRDSPEFALGVEAAQAGEVLVACPYGTGKHRRAWIDGYLSVQRKSTS